jgi:hypothetical protein
MDDNETLYIKQYFIVIRFVSLNLNYIFFKTLSNDYLYTIGDEIRIYILIKILVN